MDATHFTGDEPAVGYTKLTDEEALLLLKRARDEGDFNAFFTLVDAYQFLIQKVIDTQGSIRGYGVPTPGGIHTAPLSQEITPQDILATIVFGKPLVEDLSESQTPPPSFKYDENRQPRQSVKNWAVNVARWWVKRYFGEKVNISLTPEVEPEEVAKLEYQVYKEMGQFREQLSETEKQFSTKELLERLQEEVMKQSSDPLGMVQFLQDVLHAMAQVPEKEVPKFLSAEYAKEGKTIPPEMIAVQIAQFITPALQKIREEEGL